MEGITYVHRIVLLELRVLLDLAHHDDNRRYTSKNAAIAGAFIGLPGIDEMGDALLEELSIDLNVCHPRSWPKGVGEEMADTKVIDGGWS